MSMSSKLLKMARENYGDDTGNLDESQIETALADNAVTAEVNAEVVAPLGEIDQGLADVGASVTDADALAANADRLEETIDAGGVDPLTAEIVSDQISAAQERWLGHVSKFQAPARESFNTSSGKREATRAIVNAAREADKSIMEQAKAAISAAIKWLVDIVKQAFSKHERLLACAKAMAKVDANTPINDKISVKADVLNGVGVSQVPECIKSMTRNLDVITSLISDGDDFDGSLCKFRIGGKTSVDATDGKIVFVKEPIEKETEVTEGMNGYSINTYAGLLEKALIDFKKAAEKFSSENAVGITGIMKAAVAKPVEGQSRSQAISNARALTSIVGFTTRTVYASAGALLDVMQASIKPSKK